MSKITKSTQVLETNFSQNMTFLEKTNILDTFFDKKVFLYISASIHIFDCCKQSLKWLFPPSTQLDFCRGPCPSSHPVDFSISNFLLIFYYFNFFNELKINKKSATKKSTGWKDGLKQKSLLVEWWVDRWMKVKAIQRFPFIVFNYSFKLTFNPKCSTFS